MRATQEQAIKHMLGNRNCFLTGAGGTGKSYTLNEVIKHFDFQKISYGLTASTGVSAQSIMGQTVHSFLGLGISTDISEVTTAWWKRKVKPMIKDLQVLIIDEISMIGADLLDLINEVLQEAKGNDKVFGGVRTIFVGDLFQLPPVKDDYCFLSEVWSELDLKILNLKENYRSKGDTKFTKILNKIRVGNIDKEVLNMFKNRHIDKIPNYNPDDDIVNISSTNKEVDVINTQKLKAINAKEYQFKYYIKDPNKIVKPKDIAKFFKNSIARSILDIKVGAYVMIIVNDNTDFQYVNGTTGHIISIDKINDIVSVELKDGSVVDLTRHPFSIVKKTENPTYGTYIEDDNGKNVYDNRKFIKLEASVFQMPIILAYSLTAHKVQSLTLEKAVIDLSRGFVAGQAYVALSRLTSEKGLYLKNLPTRASLQVHPDVIMYVEEEYQKFVGVDE